MARPVQLLLVLLLTSFGLAKKKSSSSDVIEEVDRKKLEKLIESEEYLAVFFYTKSCKECPLILEELERIDDDAEKFGVAFAKNSEKSTAKKHGITSFPSLLYFRNKQPAVFDGDLMDEEKVLAWLTDLEAMELPDKIEEVNAKILENVIEDTDFVAVLFYRDNCEQCDLVLQELENIDDEADAKGIGFVKIVDESLAVEYGFDTLPALVYYRKKIPLLYDGDLLNEEEVLNWLFEFQDLGEEAEAIEDVSARALKEMIEESPFLAVLFYDVGSRRSQRVMEELENIDDDADRNEIPLVKIDDQKLAAEYGIDELPAMVYFENKVPNFYQGDLTKEEQVLQWLVKQKTSDEIEDVTDKVLEQMIKKADQLAVLFYDGTQKKSKQVLLELENIDDDTDKLGIPFVKIDDNELAADYGIEQLPVIVYFANQVPNFYDGDMTTEEDVLAWLQTQQKSDKIETVSDKVLEQMIDKSDYLAVLFYNKNDPSGQKVLAELEHIDDEADEHDIPFVKSESVAIADAYGINELPAMAYFENRVPNIYQGDLSNEGEVLKWLISQQSSDEIEDVSPKVLDQMIAKTEHLSVLFYNKEDPMSEEVLHDLEKIDDEADERGMPFVRIHDVEVAKYYGVDDELPALVYFEKKIPSIYQGDLKNEDEVLNWLIVQLTSDGIEEVSDKILFNLVKRNEHLAVLFYDIKTKRSQKVVKELEGIDDELDQHGILLVKTNDKAAGHKFGIKKLPALVFFEKENPIKYEGNLMREEEVLQWLIEQQASDEIEDINVQMLIQFIDNSQFLAVLFYDKDHERSEKILLELENIDDDTDRHGIPFVRIDDDSVAKEYGILDELPILVYFENKVPSVYEGDLMNEEQVLDWIIRQKEEDTIEEVTEEILEDLIKEYEYVLVFFAPENCPECEHILKELENIDDDTDEHGIMFVTTDDLNFATNHSGIKKFPAIILFRNGKAVPFKGDLMDEDALLKWVTSEDALDHPDEIEEVNVRMLDKMLDTSDFVAVLFYKDGDPECTKVLSELENIDDDAESYDIDFVKISDPSIANDYSILTFPTLVFFRKKFPQFYEGNLKEEEKVLKWLVDTMKRKNDRIEYVDRKMLELLMEDVESLTVYFYDKNCPECDAYLQRLEKIDGETDRQGIHFLKTDDVSVAEDLGVTSFPSLVYFEHKIPSIYSGDLMEEKKILQWLMHQKHEDTIENINRDMLYKLIEDQDYLAVFFYLENHKDSETIIHELENIDDDCGEFDVHLVKMSDNAMAKKYGIRNPPGLIFFRHGRHIKYTGDLMNEDEVLDWLTNPENVDLADKIEKVNERMLEKIMKKNDFVGLLFYSKMGCKHCERFLEEMENIDDDAAAEDIKIIKIEDKAIQKKFGVISLPTLMFFKTGEKEPAIYAGDTKSADRILDWLRKQKDPSVDYIEELEGEVLVNLIRESDAVAVFFYDKHLCQNCGDEETENAECWECQIILEELENIDDDTDRNGIHFIKTTDLKVAKTFAVKQLPALVYFEQQVPSIYEGDLATEEEVLEWLITQKSEDTIETVNKDMLEQIIEKTQYLAVFFYKTHCRACDQAVQELENIDDDTDDYGISIVKINDITLAKRYGIKTFPALVYFRNGNPLIYDGDLKNEESVYEWLTDDDNRELPDEIETINAKMLSRLVEDSPYLAVFFTEPNCYDCDRVLMELENIDDECDVFGIDLVKVYDQDAAKQWNVNTFPTVAFFRKQVPIFYDGDLQDEEQLLKWLTSSELREIKDEIEEVNKKMLEKLLEDNEFVAVYFYDNNCEKCDDILRELEHIDDEAGDLEILFVKIRDIRYSRKYGISQIPAMVFFRKKFPSIYRGDLLQEEEVLDWLQKNRYRNSELNLFIYGLAAVSSAFILYTVFLVFFMKPKEKKE